MFEVGYSEILVIAIVLIVIVGPKDLPKMLRAFGKTMTKFRQMSGDFQRQFNDALKEAELDDVRKTISDVRKLDPRQQVRDVFNPLRDAGNALKADLSKPVQTPVAPAVVPPSADLDKPVDVTMGGAKPAAQEPKSKKAVKTAAAKPASIAKPAAAKTSASKGMAKPTDKPVVKAASKSQASAAATKAKQTKGKTIT
jgi:sec-independent protein translocase protein TatB